MQGKLQQYYKALQQSNEQALAQRRDIAYSQNPALKELDSIKSGIICDFSLKKITREQADARLAELKAQRSQLLADVYLASTYLDLKYHCPNCKDTGFVGEDIKKPCICYLKNMQRFMLEGARINEHETFNSFCTDIYPDDLQRTRSNRARRMCEAYANALPKPKPCNVLLAGQSGLGKSFLGNAIAHRAIENGILAHRITAYRFVQDVLGGLKDRENRIDKYATVPLLVLDDLGIEPMINNVTRESLLSIISERQGANLATVLITNLTYEELAQRYTERFASRLFDPKATLMIQLQGQDLRGLRG